MADKFPALESIDSGVDAERSAEEVGNSDFLAREKELLGDEFKTEQDQDVLAGSDNEINEFMEQFPDVDGAPVQESAHETEIGEAESETSQPREVFQGESKALNEWRERRDLEIEEREKANATKKEAIIAKAQQTIDDFYENYNKKKEQGSEQVLKEQEDFLNERDGFLKNGTLWDRVGLLLNEAGDVDTGSRDKSRFKKLLETLKGKENVPGATGY